MIGRLDRVSVWWGHARPRKLSRYLEGDLAQGERLALEGHLRECAKCRRLLESLEGAVRAVSSMRAGARSGLAESVIATLRARAPQNGAPLESSPLSSPSLTLVSEAVPGASDAVPRRARWRAGRPGIPRAVLSYRRRRPQLRVTLPLALLVGVALSLINKGYMIFNGQVDVEMCAVCALDFVIPFVALNVGLLVATRVTRRRGL
jgi:anti-sigma factor RsiW